MPYSNLSRAIALFVGVVVTTFLIGCLIWAWTGPGATPPEGNVPAPLNVGIGGQIKSGGLGIAWSPPDGDKGLLVKYGKVGIGTTDPGCSLDLGGGTICGQGDIIFEKDNQRLWRMFEDEDGLYLESLKTGRIYRFVLEEITD